MIRNLVIVAGASTVLALASLGGAFALGAHELEQNDWSWKIVDPDGDTIRFERVDRADRGPDVSRTLAWTGGDRLSIDLPAEITYVQGPEAGVVVTGAQAVVDQIRVEDGRIFIDRRNSEVVVGWGHHGAWSDHDGLKIRITAPSINQFELAGSGELVLRDYDQPRLNLDVSGSGEVKASGTVQTLSVDISGSGEVDLSDLATTDAEVAISGSGEARIAPTGAARIDIAGSGDVYLETRPTSVQSDISGSGEVHQ